MRCRWMQFFSLRYKRAPRSLRLLRSYSWSDIHGFDWSVEYKIRNGIEEFRYSSKSRTKDLAELEYR